MNFKININDEQSAIQILLMLTNTDTDNVRKSLTKLLLFAVIKNYSKLISILVVDERVTINEKVIDWAFDNQRIDVLKSIINNPNNGHHNYMFIQSIYENQIEIFNLLLCNVNCDVTCDDDDAIQIASEMGNILMVNLLLKDGRVNPGANKNYAIRWASEKGHYEIVKILLGHPKVDPSDRQNCAIQWAAEKGHVEVVQVLIKNYKPTSLFLYYYCVGFMIACEKNRANIVDLIMNHPIFDTMCKTYDMSNAFDTACRKGAIDVVKILLINQNSNINNDDNIDNIDDNNENETIPQNIVTLLKQYRTNRVKTLNRLKMENLKG